MNKEKLHYNSLLRRYFKYIRRKKSLEAANRNERRQQILARHIERLHEKLVSLKMSLQRGAVVSAVAVGAITMMPNDADAQSFGQMQTNPFNLTNVGAYGYSNPTLGDIDGDGDLDLLSSNYEYFYNSSTDYGYLGNFVYYENTGTNANPSFGAPQTNPYGLTPISQYWNAAPTFVDLDDDGDLDVMSGGYYGDFYYYENTGTSAAPTFAAAQINPFSLAGIGYASGSKPAFADIDNDGDFDMMISDLYYSSDIYYFENTGTNLAPNFAAVQTNPFSINPVSSPNSNPTLYDIDGDGDFDLVIGGSYGNPANVHYFENTGTIGAATFGPEQVNPFGLTPTSNRFNALTFADLNNDGLIDALAGDSDGDHYYWPGCQPDQVSLNITTPCAYTTPSGGFYTATGTYTENLTNSSGCDSTVTINLTIAPFQDLTPDNATIYACNPGETATVNYSSSDNDVDYYLRDDTNDTIVDGPIAGDGNALAFTTGAITTPMTYNVYAEKEVPSGGLLFKRGDFGAASKVDCGNDPSIQISGTAITIETWVYPTNFSGSVNDGNIINKEQNGPGSDFGYMLRCGDNGALNFNLGSGSWNDLTAPQGTLVLEQWQHIAATYDGTDMIIYVDGVQVASQSVSISFSSGNTNLTVGNWSNGNNRAFEGKLDEVRIWSVTRSATDIQNNINECLTGTETGLQAYYQMEDGTGSTTLSDLTANGNDGSLNPDMDPNTDWTSGSEVCASCTFELTQTITASVISIDNSITNTANVLTAGETGASYQWLDCDNNFSVITGETSQAFTPTANGNYAVEIMSNGCADTSACEAIVGLGINGNGFGDAFAIYPNPASEIINIDLGQVSNAMQIRLVSLEGKELYMNNVNEQLVRLDLSTLPKGVYVLNISDGENQSFHKIIKQ